MRRQYLYVYRCRHHRPWLRWLTCTGYVGVTNRPDLRDAQHRTKDWYDLVRRRYVIPLGRMPRWLALVMEWALIKIAMPVYNVQHNRGNPRRVRPWDARAQRAARDARRLAPALAVRIVPTIYLWRR